MGYGKKEIRRTKVISASPSLDSGMMIRERCESGMVFIVGGGPSLSKFNFGLLKGKDVISVNQSIFKIPDSKYFVTMDFTWLYKSGVLRNMASDDSRKQFISSKAHKIFVIGFKEPKLKVIDEKHVVDTDIKLTYDLTLFNTIIRISDYGGIGESLSDFRCGSDSGYSAIQLAVILGYSQIFLLGFDFTTNVGKTHWHDSYPPRKAAEYQKKLDEFLTPYPKAFEDIRRIGSCEVYSCSKFSRLNQYIDYVDLSGIL